MRDSVRLWVLLALFGWLGPCYGQTENFVVVVNASVDTASLGVSDLRRIFAARQQFWRSGNKVTVVMRRQNSEPHRQFCREYLSLFPYQLERIWNQLVFSGQAEAPLYSSSDDITLDIVARTPGAVGYVSESVELPETVKIIEISGGGQ